jgi:hypothetical protein
LAVVVGATWVALEAKAALAGDAEHVIWAMVAMLMVLFGAIELFAKPPANRP